MKDLILSLSIVLTLCFFFSCKDDDNVNPTNESIPECTFEQGNANMDGIIDDNERAIMEECREDALSSKESIKENLIGTWELIGHGEGWFRTLSQPCSAISFGSNELIFTFANSYIDTTIISGWDIIDGFTSPVLESNIGSFGGVFINTFCSQYMFGDATPVDGNMHLYEKID